MGKAGDGNGMPFQDGTADAAPCDVIEEVVDRLAKERFTKDHRNAIIRLDRRERAFIDRMIRSGRWRRLLIDLTVGNEQGQQALHGLPSVHIEPRAPSGHREQDQPKQVLRHLQLDAPVGANNCG